MVRPALLATSLALAVLVGTYTRQGSTLSFTRTAGGGEGFPYLLGPGTVSSDRDTVTLLYGDEGPGSDQIQATFSR